MSLTFLISTLLGFLSILIYVSVIIFFKNFSSKLYVSALNFMVNRFAYVVQERSGATVSLANRTGGRTGAIVTVQPGLR